MLLRLFLSLLCAPAWLAAQTSLPPLPLDWPITNGLIRWWPNLFDVRDEVTGQEGVVVGVLPPVETGAADETTLGRDTGWVQLRPALTNEVFTLVFWAFVSREAPTPYVRLLAQESAEGEWILQTDRGNSDFIVSRYAVQENDWTEAVRLEPERWHHVVLARRADGTSLIWADGVRKLDGRLPRAWPTDARWLSVGNSIKGGEGAFHGQVRDLGVFDRVLTDDEVRALQARGLPHRRARNTSARLAATARPVEIEVSTNVITAPTAAWTHRRFTTEDGLPGNVVKAVLQARNGYLWVGTEDGLARFDGRRFRAFTPDNTPALRTIGRSVWSLAEDAEGTIWVGLFGGLLRIRGLEFTAFTDGLPQRFVLQAEPAGDGTLWIAGFKTEIPRGPCWLRRYDPTTGRSQGETTVPGHVRQLVATANGVWLATEQSHQIHFWDGRGASTTLVAVVDEMPPNVRFAAQSPLRPIVPRRVWQDAVSRTNCWTDVAFEAGGPTFHWLWDPRLSRPWVARWSGPPTEEVWLGVSYELAHLRPPLSGVAHTKPSPPRIPTLERVETSDRSAGPEIACLCANHEGGVWFGTEEDGLHLVRERLIHVFTAADGLGGNDVRSIARGRDDTLWAVSATGLSSWRHGRWQVHSSIKTRAVGVDAQGQPWVSLQQGGQGALVRVLENSVAAAPLDLEWQDPNTIRFARDGTLWIVCERGVTWIKPEGQARMARGEALTQDARETPLLGRFRVGQELPPSTVPLGCVEDDDGAIWVGSLAHGLFRLTGGRVDHFTRTHGLPHDAVTPAYLDARGALWITGPGTLTRRYEGKFLSLTESKGLPKDQLLDLIEDDDGQFWISGKRGIHRFNRADIDACLAGESSRVLTLTLGLRHGLLTPECASLHFPSMAKTDDGHIWVATRNGLANFDPRRVSFDTRPLPALIEQVRVNHRELAPLHPHPSASPLRLPPGSGQQIEFHYTAISLPDADRVRFRHRLDRYDRDWAPATDLPLAFYTNLRPGAYRFRVKAANAHGIWSDDEAALSFVIQPYFWQTTAFYLGVAVAVIALAAALHYRRLAVQRRLQELRHQQALTQEKARIAADMHDELGAALTQIAILGEVAKSQAGEDTRTRSTLDRISRAAREVTSRMSDLVWATNPRNDTLDNLAAYLREHAASQIEATPLRVQLRFPTDYPERRVSATFRRNLLLVLKEALNNVLKHAQASAVAVDLEITELDLRLRVQDDGRGFSPGTSPGVGNGLGNMRKRIEDLGGRLTLTSAPSAGTAIEARVPWRQ